MYKGLFVILLNVCYFNVDFKKAKKPALGDDTCEH